MRYSEQPLQIRKRKPPTVSPIYRLEVTYPDVDTMMELIEEGQYFPRERRYLSYSAAQSRAQAFRNLGCHVQVIKSKPVEWE